MKRKTRKKPRILVVFGTRPEALKLAPVIREGRKHPRLDLKVGLTAQHREMTDQVLDLFRIRPDFDLDLMRKGQTLNQLAARVLEKLSPVLERVQPDLLMVQGDTSSAFAAALAAFYHQIPVAHVEAGLRSHDRFAPFPEEMNRVLVSRLADFHFVPTRLGAQNLKREGIPARTIHVTGNTIVDALQIARKENRRRKHPVLDQLEPGKRLVLVTAHLRESFGEPLASICRALLDLTRRYPDLQMIFPVHPNPRVRKPVEALLGKSRAIRLVKPLGYGEFLALLDRASLVLTDSGGIQEEAPSFGKPVVVLRDVTERREAIDAGWARLAGTSRAKIVREADFFLRGRSNRKASANPFGDGRAARRILKILDDGWKKRQSFHAFK